MFCHHKIVSRGKNKDQEGNFTKGVDSDQDDVHIATISCVAWPGRMLCKRA